MKVIALYPGTFDPITNGHTDLVRRAARPIQLQAPFERLPAGNTISHITDCYIRKPGQAAAQPGPQKTFPASPLLRPFNHSFFPDCVF